MDPNNGVYDKDDHEPVTKPDLLRQEEGNSKPEPAEKTGLFNPNGDKAGKGNEAIGSQSLNQAESGLPGEKLGRGYNPLASSGGLSGRIGGIIKNPKSRRRALIIGGSGGGIATFLAIAVFMFAPLKIESLMNGIQHHFEATTMYAVTNETQNIFTSYITKHVLPSYKGCGTTISKDCSVNNIIGTNPVDNLYKTWANAKIENKLAEDYGIEFKYDSASKSWYIKAPGLSSEGENIGKEGEGLDSVFRRADQAALRGAVNDALEKETKWKAVLYRYKYGRLLEEKYGVKRCVIFCGTQDALQNFSNEKKNAAQIFITQRVLVPRTDTLGIVMECLLDKNCDAESTQPTNAEDGSSGELAGEAENPQTDTAVRTNLEDLARTYGITDKSTIENMIKEYETIDEKGYSNYALEAILEKVGLSDLSQNIADTAPLIGWANTAATVIADINKSGPTVKKLSFLTNSAAAVSFYMLMRSWVDELHTGHADAIEVGSMVNAFGSGNGASNELGGNATAEQTPLFNYISNGGSTSTSSTSVSLINSILPNSTAYADSSSSPYSNYKCRNGKPVPSGQLVCAENMLGGGNAALNTVHQALNTFPLSAITSLASAWNSLPGQILGFFGNLFGSVLNSIPGISSLIHDAASFVANIAKPFFTFLTNTLVPDPFGSNMSGGQTYVDAAMGADASYSTYGQTGIGGRELSASEVTAIDNQETAADKQQFSQESIFARLFDTSSNYSLISKVALDMPTSIQSGAESTFSSLITSPFRIMSQGFASLFSGNAFAQTQGDPFEIPPYGYTKADLDKIGDASTYWDTHCSDNASQAYQNNNNWNEQAAQTTDPNTGMPENTTTNPCLLIQTIAGSAGGDFNSSLLTQDDLSDVNNSNTGNSSSPTSSSCSGGGKYSALVGSGSSYAGADQGIDFVPSSNGSSYNICAPDSGTITLADQTGHQFNRTTGQAEVIEKLDQTPNAPSSSQYIYYAELVNISSNIHVGSHVNAGDLIGTNSQSPGIEVGWGQSPNEGFLCTTISYPTPCGTSFDNWIQKVSSGGSP